MKNDFLSAISPPKIPALAGIHLGIVPSAREAAIGAGSQLSLGWAGIGLGHLDMGEAIVADFLKRC
ncbi:MAG: hypothetical protein ACRBEQ_09825, partial [Hyphomonas sp.]